jgi:hypothetical protein
MTRIDLAGEQVVQRKPVALVGDDVEVHAGSLLELQQGEMVGAAVAGMADRQLAGVGLEVGQHSPPVLDAAGGIHLEHHRGGGEHGNRRKARQCVGRLAAGHPRADEEGSGRAQHERVAVGRRIGDLLAADGAAGSAAIFHHHRLAKPLGQSLGKQATGDVGISAGSKRHDKADRLVGIALGASVTGQEHRRDEQGATVNLHARPTHS